MALTEYERGNTFKSQVTFTSGSTNVDCSGNIANLTVYAPDGTIFMGPESGQHVSTGIYRYYVSTQTDSLYGIYVLEWKGLFNYGSPYNYAPKYDRTAISIVNVK